MTVHTVGHDLIESRWFATYRDHGDGSVTILEYRRDHLPRNAAEAWGRPVEDASRTVTHLDVGTVWPSGGLTPPLGTWERMTVRNPRHVFSYKS